MQKLLPLLALFGLLASCAPRYAGPIVEQRDALVNLSTNRATTLYITNGATDQGLGDFFVTVDGTRLEGQYFAIETDNEIEWGDLYRQKSGQDGLPAGRKWIFQAGIRDGDRNKSLVCELIGPPDAMIADGFCRDHNNTWYRLSIRL